MLLRSEFPDYDILRNLKLVKIAHDRFREVCKRRQGLLKPAAEEESPA